MHKVLSDGVVDDSNYGVAFIFAIIASAPVPAPTANNGDCY